MALNLFASLSVLWLIRNLSKQAGKGKIRVREAVYFGPAQLVPFITLGLLLLLQLLPSLIVADFGAQLRENGVLGTNLEQAAGVAVILSFLALSFYWLAGGIFSLIIISLPGFEAARSLADVFAARSSPAGASHCPAVSAGCRLRCHCLPAAVAAGLVAAAMVGTFTLSGSAVLLYN